jgi:hypothetical protein
MINTVFLSLLILAAGITKPMKEIALEDSILFEDTDEETTMTFAPTEDYTFHANATSKRTSANNQKKTTEKMTEDGEYKNLKVERIENSFHFPSHLVHKDKPELRAEAVWEVFPDELLSCYQYGVIVML